MNDAPTAAPASSDASEVNLLLDAARIPFAVSAAAVALAAAGFVVALVGVQNLALVTWRGAYAAFPWVLLVAGIAGIAVAAKLMHARRWSLAAGLAVAIVLALASVGFFALASLAGVFSPLAFVAIAGGVTAVVLVALAIGPFRRLAAVRRRLRESGFDLDL
jgi:hypothetical protein